jgi:threonine/homoserine/homoserine lactone efflux protein
MSFFILWLGVMLPLVFSPGPANIVFAASGAKVGLKRSLPLMAGIDTVFIIKSVVIGFGFGGVIEQYPLILQLLQFVGSVYIIYLAVGFLLAGRLSETKSVKTLGFKDGVVIQLLNAKGWVMVILMYSLFTESAREVFGSSSILVLVALLAILNISVHMVWIKAGELITKAVSSKHNHQVQSVTYFLSLMIVAGWLVIDNPFWYQ